MPFVSKAQRRYLFANKPEMAKRWAAETPKNKSLPERLGPTKTQKAKARLHRGMAGKKR